MADRSNSSPPGSPALQTVLTLTAGNSDQHRRTFVWGPPVDPFGVGTRGLWYVHGPGVLHVHLYLAFDGRQVQVAAAEGASVTLHGTEVGQLWRPVPVNSELHFASAKISVTCEEIPATASGSVPPEGTGTSPRTLIVDRTVAMDEVLAGGNGPLEPALPRTGTLRLMERAWAPPTPQPQTPPPPPPASPGLSKNTQPAGGNAHQAPVAPPPEPPLDPRITKPPTPIVPQAPITPPRAVTAQPPITKPPTPIAPQAPITPPRGATEPITKPPTPISPRAPVTPAQAVSPSPRTAPQPIAPQAPVTAPSAMTPPRPIIPDIPLRGPLRPPEGPLDHVPLGAPQSEAVPTMADGGALREHARRLDGAAPDAGDPAAREYFSAVRVYSGKSPSEPPPAKAEAPAPPPPWQAPPPKAPSNPPPAEPPPRVVEPAPVEKKQKTGFAQSWKETSLVKKAILFLLPVAAAATLFDLQAESESEEAETREPAAATSAGAAAAAKAAPSGAAAASGQAAPPSAASAVKAEMAAPPASATVESAALIPLSSVAAPASAAPAGSNEPMITMVPSGPGAASAVAANSAAAAGQIAPQPSAASSAGAAPVASAASSAGTAPVASAESPAGAASEVAASDESDKERAIHLFEHLALNAVFEGNMAQASTLYEKLAAGSPDSRIYALAARLTKAGAVRTP